MKQQRSDEKPTKVQEWLGGCEGGGATAVHVLLCDFPEGGGLTEIRSQLQSLHMQSPSVSRVDQEESS